MLTLDFTPPSITVRTIVGASVAFSLTAKNADGSLFPLAGYTVTAPFLPRDGVAPPVDSLTVELTDVATLTCTLTGEQTQQLAAGYVQMPLVWNWVTWLVNDVERIALVRGGLSLTLP